MECCNLHAAGVNDPGYNKRSLTILARSQHNAKHQPMANTRKKSSKGHGRRWSAAVTKHSDALDLERKVLKSKDPHKIALALKRSATQSKRRKGTPYQSAMSMLNFYILAWAKHRRAQCEAAVALLAAQVFSLRQTKLSRSSLTPDRRHMAVTCVLKAMQGRIALPKLRRNTMRPLRISREALWSAGRPPTAFGTKGPFLYSQASVNKARVSSTPVRQIFIISSSSR